MEKTSTGVFVFTKRERESYSSQKRKPYILEAQALCQRRFALLSRKSELTCNSSVNTMAFSQGSDYFLPDFCITSSVLLASASCASSKVPAKKKTFLNASAVLHA